MEATAWVAVAIIALGTGDVVVVHNPKPMKTEEECVQLNKDAIEQVKDNKEIVGLGTSCVKIVVKPHGAAS